MDFALSLLSIGMSLLTKLDLFTLVFGAVCFGLGVAWYNYMLKKNPEKLKALLAKAEELVDKAKDKAGL